MYFPETLQTNRETVRLQRVRRPQYVTYTMQMIADGDHIGRYQTPNAVAETGDGVLQIIWNHLSSRKEVHMGIYDDGAFTGAIHTLPAPEYEASEVGIWIAKAHTRRGLARIALQAFLEPVKTIQPNVIAFIHEENAPSIRLFEGVGFSHAATDGPVRLYEHAAHYLQG
jgi:ribosomal protein S18 acetylase RimI-like enzyme